jgi:uncharacterized repeat protein (TIGR01451 family)
MPFRRKSHEHHHADHDHHHDHDHDHDVIDDDRGDIDAGLKVIYGNDQSDLHTFKRDSSRLTRFLTKLVVGLSISAILAFGGYFIYANFFSQSRSHKPLEITITVPSEVKSGERTQLVIAYANPTNTPLASLELDINLPPTFVLKGLQPEPTQAEDLIWTLGSLGARSDGKITLEGVWLSPVPSTTNIQVLAAYRPGNFNSQFSDIATASVNTLASTLVLEVKGPEAAVPGQELSYTASVKNLGTETMDGVTLALTLPAGFLLTTSTPSLAAGADPIWDLGTLTPEATTEIVWTGSFTSEISDIQQFTAVAQIPAPDTKLSQATTQWFTDVAGSSLRAALVVNGNSDKASTELGSTLRMTVRLENAGDKDITDANVVIDFKPDSGIPVIWDNASLGGGELTSAGIVFDTETLGVIKPGEKKLYNLSFPIKDSLAPTEVDAWQATAFVTSGDSQVQTPPFPIALTASAALSAEARYFTDDGVPIGSGPLPPVVGQMTAYRLTWKIHKAVHDLENISVTASLPPDVTWDNRVLTGTGNVTFDQATQTVRWNIDNLPANQEAMAEFTLKLLPGEEDLGTFVKLLSGSIFSATDAVTDAGVEVQADPVTTEIPGDEFAQGKGTVVSE